ncbi:glycosyltransferase [Solirubrobacter phytolaccae]|uniref:Glycosyltransferase n=1 Tax=Solirubrobacter phytolaccae TaxID=1404360 RepID=A0A9X3ND19_9ACTN|nr:glycosyltransferase [Solirubrobacter phytolaccae]MDA0183824.1 glycosyltransferase [Solirubrobacter phytolaccae]
MTDIPKTLFLGLGASVVSYYRCFLPAIALGAEYATWGALADDTVVLTGGLGNPPPSLENLPDYEVVVIQYANGRSWLKRIRELQDRGVKVLYEIDDYVQAARKSKTHELAHKFGADRVRDLEMGMRAVDGMICSTSFIARRYRSFSEHTWECRNGVDLNRYDYRKPDRKGVVTIGFAGGVGHKASLARWEPAIRSVMRQRENVRFVSVGHAAAAPYAEEFGADRAVSYPSSGIEVYPASMALFDIAFAPSAENNQFRGKSDLRWLEASALGIPLVAHPDVYPDIEDGVTGVHAREVDEVEAALLRLIDDHEARERIGATAHEYVREHRRIEVAAQSWAEVLREVVAGHPAHAS